MDSNPEKGKTVFHYLTLCFGSRLWQFCLNALVQFALTLHFHPEEFGRFATLFSIISLGNMVLSLRLPLQILHLKQCDIPLYLNVCLQEGIWVLWILAALLSFFFPISLDLLLLLLSGFLGRIVDFLRAVRERASGQLDVLKIEKMISILSNIVILLCLSGGMGTLLLSLRECIPSLGFICFLYRDISLKWKWIGFPNWKLLLRQGRYFWIDNLFEHGFLRLSIIFIQWLGGEGYAGYYYQAQRLVLIPYNHFCSLATRHVFYLFSRASDWRESQRICRQFCLWLSVLLVPMAVSIYFQGVGFGLLVLKREWIPMLEILELMGPGLVFLTLFSIHKVYFLATNASKPLSYSRICQALGFAIPYLVFSPQNKWALGTSFSLGYLFAFLSSSYWLSREQTSSIIPKKI